MPPAVVRGSFVARLIKGLGLKVKASRLCAWSSGGTNQSAI